MIGGVVLAPDMVEEFLLADGRARIRHEVTQNGELTRRQVQDMSVPGADMACGIKR
jgi:hypothetical protein